VHVCSHVIHYGSCIFEGIRCYKTPQGPAIFRLHEHIERLFEGCRIYRMEIPFTREALEQATVETVRINKMEACYIRPLAYRGYESLGVDPFPCPIEVAIAVWPWGAYLGKEATEKGVDVMVSSWRREAPDTLPTMAKASANYMNSQLIKMESQINGYAEGIALDAYGFVSEGSGENLFLVKRGTLYTPPLTAGDHPADGADDRRRSRDPDRGAERAARDAVHLRRGILRRDRDRDHPDPERRPAVDWKGGPGRDHRAHPGGVHGRRSGREARPPRLADPRARPGHRRRPPHLRPTPSAHRRRVKI
jgi:hypothetical protein